MKGTLHHDGQLHTLRFERPLDHTPEKVWRALTENSELAHWFPAEIHGAREKGAPLRFVMPPEPGQTPADSPATGPTQPGEMLMFDPPRTLEYSWDGEILRWELHPRNGGTLLIFSHTFEDESKAARDGSGWDMCLDSLENRLAGRRPEPFTPDRFSKLFDDYAQRFGSKASVKKSPDA